MSNFDGLSQDDQALAWVAGWHPSFEGKAIVSKDFKFLGVNPRFCEICNASPAEIMAGTFGDITPIEIRKLDELNAQMVVEGQIESYMIPKSYKFAGREEVKVNLIVKGVFKDGEFLFFVSSILEAETKERKQPDDNTGLLDFLVKHKKELTAATATIGAFVAFWDSIKRPFIWLIKQIAKEL